MSPGEKRVVRSELRDKVVLLGLKHQHDLEIKKMQVLIAAVTAGDSRVERQWLSSILSEYADLAYPWDDGDGDAAKQETVEESRQRAIEKFYDLVKKGLLNA